MNNNEFRRMKYAQGGRTEEMEQGDPLSEKFQKLQLHQFTHPHHSEDLDQSTERWMERMYPVHSSIPSDAVLSCPCCFSILSNDCQRHEEYSNQYRAMFVYNCRVTSDLIRLRKKRKERRGRQRSSPSFDPSPHSLHVTEEMMSNLHINEQEEYDIYRPVKCAICYTDVGVFDVHEIYHFYHVLAGY